MIQNPNSNSLVLDIMALYHGHQNREALLVHENLYQKVIWLLPVSFFNIICRNMVDITTSVYLVLVRMNEDRDWVA